MGVTAPITLSLTVSAEWMKRNREANGEREIYNVVVVGVGGGVGGTLREWGGGLSLSGQLS